MFSEQRGNIYFFETTISHQGTWDVWYLEVVFELLPFKTERFSRQTMMVHSIYLLQFRTSEK